MKTTLNTIVPKSTVLTDTEATGYNTVWDNLLALSKFAGCSKPERGDAISQLNHAVAEYEMRDWQQEVIHGIILVLKIDPQP